MKLTGEEHGLTSLPGGGMGACTVGAVDGVEYAVLRVVTPEGGDRIAVAGPRWMDVETARAVGAALFEMAEG